MPGFNDFYEVVIPRPLRKTFTYGWSGGETQPEVGCLVKVPFGKTSLQGIVINKLKGSPNFDISKVKPITALYSDSPVISQNLLDLTQWMSRYYLCSWGEAIFNSLPAFPKKSVDMTPVPLTDIKASFQHELTPDQVRALTEINDGTQPALLHGVTGSGKTEVYLRKAEEVLSVGKSVIYLVPEITLISQIKLFCENTFKGQVTLIHSKQTPKERREAWVSLKRGEKRFVLGPRSALFAPVKDLGLIIVDEEHDPSYKQSETPRYHTVKTARRRAEIEGAQLILGTATPSLQTIQLVNEGKAKLVKLNQRIGRSGMASITLIDLKRRKQGQLITEDLQHSITDRLEKKQGTLIFLNRTGFSTQIKCGKCGFFYHCPHCDISLTYHQQVSKLICHYCRYALKPATHCPDCDGSLEFKGIGTEKLESEICRLFPGARVERIDREVVKKQEHLDKAFKQFRAGEIDILVGTQMITKGLDFKHLTLVGILQADSYLQLPDFKAAERTYQILEQVAGRSGRGDVAGEVILQTYQPDHYSIQSVIKKDFGGFVEKELAHRKEFQYPPHFQMINLTLRGRVESVVTQAAEDLKSELESLEGAAVEILGPAPLPFYRLRGYYRWHILVKGISLKGFKEGFGKFLARRRQPGGTYLEIDVDPEQIL